MSDTGSNKSEASTAVLDVHIGYLRDDVRRLSDEFKAAIDRMATKDDIKQLIQRIDKSATQEDLRAQADRVDGLVKTQNERLSALEKKVSEQSVPSVIERVSNWIKNVGGAIALIGAGILMIVELSKRFP